MLRFTRRGGENSRILGDYPLWLSSMLCARGVDTVEKAERFLHPSLDRLNDPMTMQDMDKAVKLICAAVADKQPIMVYGDYDVDGVCATSILLETLREMGAQVDFYIPDRHGEGYGMNCDAVRKIADMGIKLLITVDCGVTNIEEVKLAHLLGMKVIVTDHHQMPETLPQADAVLNPLREEYGCKRLCGAGVALKVCQALQGMDGVMKRIELAALATVADIVPLIDENRVIVRFGLENMASTTRPGLKALMLVSGVEAPVNAGHVGFRLAPRLNAGGRLEGAAQGVTLLTTTDEAEAERIAVHLEENNRARQSLEREITEQAMVSISEQTDFRNDKVIIVMGEGWNSGVIGLAAGRICERYHFPTIVLSVNEGTAVGSCRSIEGVNIHAMLTECDKERDAKGNHFFERFGGHEMAAGLTMKAENVPELQRRLNHAIEKKCDLSCYVPTKEYDLALPLQRVDMALIEQLDALQPTGFGNPAPVFLTEKAHVQQARRVGKDGVHLKLSLLDGDALRDGIAFSMGDVTDKGWESVDVLYSPERNEYMGQVKPQLMVKAIRVAEGSAPLPTSDALFRSLLQEIRLLAAKCTKIPINSEANGSPCRLVNDTKVRDLLKHCRGTLLITHDVLRAAAFAKDDRLDVGTMQVEDMRGFNTLLCGVDLEKLHDCWQHIVLLDGDVLPGEVAVIRQKCPRATLCVSVQSAEVTELLDSLVLDREAMGILYTRLKMAGIQPLSRLAQDCGFSEMQVLTLLTILSEVSLADFTVAPFMVRLLPPPKQKRNLEDSPLNRYLHSRVSGAK